MRSWLEFADPTFELPIHARADWRYIALKLREHSTLTTFVRAVIYQLSNSQHTLKVSHTNPKVCQNQDRSGGVPELPHSLMIQGKPAGVRCVEVVFTVLPHLAC